VRLKTPPRKKKIVKKLQRGSHGPPRDVGPMMMNVGWANLIKLAGGGDLQKKSTKFYRCVD
jgi:hypothetical protein